MKKIKITLVKSPIDRPERQKQTLKALGLNKMNASREVEATPQILGYGSQSGASGESGRSSLTIENVIIVKLKSVNISTFHIYNFQIIIKARGDSPLSKNQIK